MGLNIEKTLYFLREKNHNEVFKGKEMTRFSKKLIVTFGIFLIVHSLFAVEITSKNAKKYRELFIEEVKKHIGAPYQYGSCGPSTFDCSGLINYSALQATEIQLPRTARAIYNSSKIISAKDREIGDLLFFKTTGTDSITHVGVYIGNNQFISALSEGANTGVIVSSLNQDYWRTRYVATGQFLPPSNEDDFSDDNKQLAKTDTKTDKTKSDKNKTGNKKKSDSLFDDIIIDGALFVDWSLVSANSFAFQFRGFDLDFNARYSAWTNEPGIQLGLFYDPALKIFQIPVSISLTINNYLRAYAGPVLSMGNPNLIGSDKEIRASVFPGIIGLTLSTDNLEIGSTTLQFVQDIRYTVFNNTDNSALSIFESLAAGLVFHTGVRVSLPLSVL